MRILVCMKQVPDTTDIKIDPKTNTLKRDGVPSIMNPDDKTALEVALRLKDEYGAEIAVISMGPPQAEIMLREALAMGADEAYLMTDRAFAGSDTLATSTIIAAGFKKVGCDFVIGGRQAIDGDTAQVGPQIAEHLGWPQITYAVELKKDDKDVFTVKRQFEDRYQMLKVKAPFVVTVLSQMATPRYMHVKGIVEQEEKQINIINFADLDLDVNNIGLAGSPTKVKTTFTKQFDSNKEVVELPVEEAAKLIAEKLAEKHFI